MNVAFQSQQLRTLDLRVSDYGRCTSVRVGRICPLKFAGDLYTKFPREISLYRPTKENGQAEAAIKVDKSKMMTAKQEAGCIPGSRGL